MFVQPKASSGTKLTTAQARASMEMNFFMSVLVGSVGFER